MTLPKTWKERIDEALERGHFTPEDESQARSWTTCAVHEHDPLAATRIMQPIQSDKPYNYTLKTLGIDFAWAVARDRVERAARILGTIMSTRKTSFTGGEG